MIFHIVVLCPYKEMTETSNSNISKTTHRKLQNIFRDVFAGENLSFCAKKGVKNWANFPD